MPMPEEPRQSDKWKALLGRLRDPYWWITNLVGFFLLTLIQGIQYRLQGPYIDHLFNMTGYSASVLSHIDISWTHFPPLSLTITVLIVCNVAYWYVRREQKERDVLQKKQSETVGEYKKLEMECTKVKGEFIKFIQSTVEKNPPKMKPQSIEAKTVGKSISLMWPIESVEHLIEQLPPQEKKTAKEIWEILKRWK
jgi:hypothetical protein